MHLDHAGGLDQFLDRTDIEIWVHDKELRSAFWSVATGADVGVYLDHYMNVGHHWHSTCNPGVIADLL
jgi:glyoxylase-like metal-dependent hydrolase (beta-lactamase superfamily II)